VSRTIPTNILLVPDEADPSQKKNKGERRNLISFFYSSIFHNMLSAFFKQNNSGVRPKIKESA
jgi:hypothetical protein